MGWTPDVFWSCHFNDFYHAYEGWRKKNGISDTSPMTRDEMNDLMELFPDGE